MVRHDDDFRVGPTSFPFLPLAPCLARGQAVELQVADPRSKEVLDANQKLLDAIDKRDYAAYV